MIKSKYERDQIKINPPKPRNQMTVHIKLNRSNFGLHSKLWAAIFRWRLNDLACCIVLLIIYGVMYDAPPYEREIFINDMTISHTYAVHERVSTVQLGVYAVLIPVLVVVVAGLIFTNEHRFYVTWISFMGLLVSLSTCSFLTGMLKNWIGRPRPDFISRCQVKDGTPQNVYVKPSDVCQQTDKSLLNDGMRSCPSGHSSTSFAGLGYITFWLIGQTMALHKRSGAWRVCFALIPALFAGLIAISRTEDYRHRYSDITLGSLIGVFTSYWGYKRNFPSYNTMFCYVPVQLIEESNLSNDKIDDYEEENNEHEMYHRTYSNDAGMSV